MSHTPTHTYTGPTTRWGLEHGAPCTLVPGRGQGQRIRTSGGKVWIVGRHQVTAKPTRG